MSSTAQSKRKLSDEGIEESHQDDLDGDCPQKQDEKRRKKVWETFATDLNV